MLSQNCLIRIVDFKNNAQTVPNCMFTSSSDMLMFLGSIIFATAAGITAFLLLTSSNIKDFKRRFFPKERVVPLPIVTPDGKLVDSKEELEAHLEVLEIKLMEKVSELEISKTRVQDAKQSIERLHSTQSQVKKYYVKLREEIRKSEEDCKTLQEQIEDYRKRRSELDQEMKKNEDYYKSLLDAVTSVDSLASSHGSSKMSSASSSTSSFYDSNSYVFGDDKHVCQKIKKGPRSASPDNEPAAPAENPSDKNVEKVVHSSPTSKSNMSGEVSQNLQKRLSASSLEPPKEATKEPIKRIPVCQRVAGQSLVKKTSDTSVKDQRPASKESSKRTVADQKGQSQSLEKKQSSSSVDSQNDGAKDVEVELTLPGKLSGCGIQKFKVKSLKGEICCCGCSKCPGTCNLARCIKLGFLKPKDILSVEVAEHVDVLTGKIICTKNCLHKGKPLESTPKRPLTPRNMHRFT